VKGVDGESHEFVSSRVCLPLSVRPLSRSRFYGAAVPSGFTIMISGDISGFRAVPLTAGPVEDGKGAPSGKHSRLARSELSEAGRATLRRWS
jgi:hypothetical protein